MDAAAFNTVGSREMSYYVEHMYLLNLHTYHYGRLVNTSARDVKGLDMADVIETRRMRPMEENSSDDAVQDARPASYSASDPCPSFRYSLSFEPSRFTSLGLASDLLAVFIIPNEEDYFPVPIGLTNFPSSISTLLPFPFRLVYGFPNSDSSRTRSRVPPTIISYEMFDVDRSHMRNGDGIAAYNGVG